MKRSKTLRIANAGGYWGDDPYALRRQVLGEIPLDYISIDFLAEITMSILQKQRSRDPKAGYARDFVTQVEPILDEMLKRRIKIITNAGGVNPGACADALFEAARNRDLPLKVAVVGGDDILGRIEELGGRGVTLDNMETGESLGDYRDKVLSANAYFGAMPVVEALEEGPDIVLSGRVTDTGITLAALIHEFRWNADDYDRLAQGIVASHLIECGAQATGGNFTDWEKVPSYIDVGFPILEFEADGTFVVTKHPGSGGLVSLQTIREQFLYEMGHPQLYVTPDAIADFTTMKLEKVGENRVRVSGARGAAPTDLLKVSTALEDGFKSSGTLIVSGPDARQKAEVFADILGRRLEAELAREGLGPVEASCSEYIGDDST
ncbi:MAG: acyclic terpene utilization AtuA family protein, partial [Vicinamibacteria bacterium]